MRPSASTCFTQPLASLSCHALTASLLRQVTQASQAPCAAPTTFQAESGGRRKTSDRNGKELQAAAQVASRQTHVELMSQIRQADEPLSVGGELCLHVASRSVQNVAFTLLVLQYMCVCSSVWVLFSTYRPA